MAKEAEIEVNELNKSAEFCKQLDLKTSNTREIIIH